MAPCVHTGPQINCPLSWEAGPSAALLRDLDKDKGMETLSRAAGRRLPQTAAWGGGRGRGWRHHPGRVYVCVTMCVCTCWPVRSLSLWKRCAHLCPELLGQGG